MARHLVLCSDGTGNKAGKLNGTNVFKIYEAIDRHHGKVSQIGFYDNGVGTDKNKYRRILGGAFGSGFKRNVKDLYTFLAHNYELGDQIYLFGFSRGAATVRAFAGMLNACGLVKEGELSRKDLIAKVDEAYAAYVTHAKDNKAAKFKQNDSIHNSDFAPHGNLKIKFIGVWDTVSALGFPRDLGIAIKLLERVADWFLPHRFYDYELNDSIEHACQALSLDDERETFRPMVWNEAGRKPDSVEQVWFSGVHSNVGGGYPREGMANVALQWMMSKAENKGLDFKETAKKQVAASADVTDKLYDSRSGMGLYYRYKPRNLAELSSGGSIRVHESVFQRVELGTAGYAPGNFPSEFVTDGEAEDSRVRKNLAKYQAIAKRADIYASMRRVLHSAFVYLSLAVAVALVWKCADGVPQPDWDGSLPEKIAYVVNYVVPLNLEAVTYVAIVQHYWMTLVVLSAFFVMWGGHVWLARAGASTYDDARHALLQRERQPASEGGE